ncbi:MAG: DUF4169 family protein [Alphaproteobacteria bacterium]|nr:DUF4169 family protein [Alphaproteobacteria bacterium]
MTEIINLRRLRKEKARHEKEVVAEANRVKHGVSKSAHKRAKAIVEKEGRRLSSKKLVED